MSEAKLRKALENCTADAVALRKKITSIENDVEKAKRALKNCLEDSVKLRKQMRSPSQRIHRGSHGSRKRKSHRRSKRH
jgi:hypothetical protein